MLPSGQPKLLQIFSARYLEFVPENTLKGDVSLIVYYNRYNFLNFSAKLRHFFKSYKC